MARPRREGTACGRTSAELPGCCYYCARYRKGSAVCFNVPECCREGADRAEVCLDLGGADAPLAERACQSRALDLGKARSVASSAPKIRAAGAGEGSAQLNASEKSHRWRAAFVSGVVDVCTQADRAKPRAGHTTLLQVPLHHAGTATLTRGISVLRCSRLARRRGSKQGSRSRADASNSNIQGLVLE
ncbi:hypothetical protein BU26DRAFT_499273 [Trematosphaeria pertusa]|uniref:Uncharacterized protein n=1 Tax=Trematosphaeria pertusa TaxID=390896 RepID=A0A6A6J2L0_9PLEO|nr:uncharacterized protein BU26DRAFT_499273 [Trematosphaeria pertusa]KAF2256631.1 hypothetical protein BU26DRAFT_499273 [Trematosphaeria pertusa]